MPLLLEPPVFRPGEVQCFSEWLEKLQDVKGKMRIMARLNRARAGIFGNCKALEDGISEMKVDFGPGYRVYYAQEGRIFICYLLAGARILRTGT
jgi:putative addiction module killer protein